MGVYVNRILNMKKIKAIGFDMDHTLVRYNTQAFEQLTHQESLKKLVELKDYPKDILEIPFDFNLSIEGLVIDKKKGNLLKISRFGKVKEASHGVEKISYNNMQRMYSNRIIDINLDHFQSLDTSFSISNGVLFCQLVEAKKKNPSIPDFYTIADDVRESIDLVHRDGTLKNAVRKNIDLYIIQDEKLVERLEKYKRLGKRLLIITNSDYQYCKLLLDCTMNPFLKAHKHWSELFEVVVTHAKKPAFFTTDAPFLCINTDHTKSCSNPSMTNLESHITGGVYQGGFAGKLQQDLKLKGEEILYLGDHIYGDVVSIKKTFNWRTALILEPLREEIASISKCRPVQQEIDQLMEIKSSLETELNLLEEDKAHEQLRTSEIYHEIEELDKKISNLLRDYRAYFNPHWGEMMRAGNEESRFADQVEKYACLYMPDVSSLLEWSPLTYFRPIKRVLPHELVTR